MFHTVPTLTVSLLAVTVAMALWFFWRQRWPRTTLVILVGGTAGLVNTPVGRWLHNVLNAGYQHVAGWAGSMVGVGIGAVAIAIAILAGLWVGSHWHHRAISDKTLLAGGLIPWSVPFVPGAAGVALGWVVGICASVVGAVGALIFHL